MGAILQRYYISVKEQINYALQKNCLFKLFALQEISLNGIDTNIYLFNFMYKIACPSKFLSAGCLTNLQVLCNVSVNGLNVETLAIKLRTNNSYITVMLSQESV